MGRFRNITGKGISVLILAFSVKVALLACAPAGQNTVTEPEIPAADTHVPTNREQLANAINRKVTTSAAARRITVSGGTMRLSPTLPAVYQNRAYEAVWLDE
ncbi:MAG: hypothetical protein IT344_08325, partial [Candidatus Dadabacteria bacterium]|nr:hypothetical protein [Candidatus Dadabacteria bacterium]